MGTGWRKGTEAEEEEGLQGGGQIVRGEWVERGRRERERHRPGAAASAASAAV